MKNEEIKNEGNEKIEVKLKEIQTLAQNVKILYFYFLK